MIYCVNIQQICGICNDIIDVAHDIYLDYYSELKLRSF